MPVPAALPPWRPRRELTSATAGLTRAAMAAVLSEPGRRRLPSTAARREPGPGPPGAGAVAGKLGQRGRPTLGGLRRRAAKLGLSARARPPEGDRLGGLAPDLRASVAGHRFQIPSGG